MLILLGKAIAVVFFVTLTTGAATFLQFNHQESLRVDKLLGEAALLHGDPDRGAYIAAMSGCISCHTNTVEGGKPLAGGLAIKTPFGIFYTPNITSDKVNGIGSWSKNELISAVALGRSPSRDHYYPAFPYTSYNLISTQDVVDLQSWLDTVPPAANVTPEHKLDWPFSYRATLIFWKALFFKPMQHVDSKNRGEYIVIGPGHCAECHSPRSLLGGINNRSLTGNSKGPDGHPVPAITQDSLTDWSVEDITLFLEVGITPSGDFTGGHMADVIEYNTSLLTDDDRRRVAHYLLSDRNKP